MQPNNYKNAINDFKNMGGGIYDLDRLIFRGTCVDQIELVEGWSDLDFSIVVKKFTRKNIYEIKQLVQHLISTNNFKISVTVVTSADFDGLCHYHGSKPIYYSYELRDGEIANKVDDVKIPPFFRENLILFDCYNNLAYLIHDLRSRYFNCGSSPSDLILFTRHLIKRSKFIMKNAFPIVSKEIFQEISIPLFVQHFPETSHDFIDAISNAKYRWEEITKDQKLVTNMMDHAFEQVNYIYETTIGLINESPSYE
jgi:hypothetical protein